VTEQYLPPESRRIGTGFIYESFLGISSRGLQRQRRWSLRELLFSENVCISSGQRAMQRVAIAAEKLGNQLTKAYSVDILCGYSVGQGGMDGHIFHRICAEHSAVYSW
jgi:hypothetical protein